MTYYLAIDIGASGGRHILGSIQNGRLVTEEIYRFENGITQTEVGAVWDIQHIVSEVITGLAVASSLGKTPTSIAIDTWGVDYCLLDENKAPLLPVFAYRDAERPKVIPEVEALLSRKALYQKTGIQFQPFNTVYQLYADKISGKLDRARYFMQIPDYIAFCLTGQIVNEYTNATTTSLVNAFTKCWDTDILQTLGIPEGIFQPLTLPCETVGDLLPEIANKVGYTAKVVTCPTHDTASAYVATVGGDQTLTLSSGTWSLIGTERFVPLTSDEAQSANFTNEGGIEYRYRFLKNIMGMWLIQNVKKELGNRYGYEELMQMAKTSHYTEIFDVNAPSLSAPQSMIEAIKALLNSPELPIEDLISSIYHSLSASYRKAKDELETITGVQFDTLQIVGGGSSDLYLNQLTGQKTGLRILAGPKEGTAIGNLASQMMKDTGISLAEVRALIQNSFSVRTIQ